MLWNAETGTALGMLKCHSDAVMAVALSPDGTLVASASGQNTVMLRHI
jgi:WD40 repeat protein